MYVECVAGLLKTFGQRKHKYGNPLRDVILGGQDGLVNVLGVVLGVSAVTGDKSIILATGLAATFAESISMGAVAYTSFLSERDHYQKELKNESAEINKFPDQEKAELRQIFSAKGFTGHLLDEVVETVSSHKKVWLETMMDDELHLSAIDSKIVFKIAATVGLAALFGSLIPLLPFFLLPHNLAFLGAIVISGLSLFAIGAYQAISSVGDWKRSGIQMVLIGLGAALIGFLVARLFHISG